MATVTFNDGNEVSLTAAAITTPAMTPTSATFDLARASRCPTMFTGYGYSGSGASLILDLDANALDGEFNGSFPSGDGVEGGDFEATFTVTTPAAVTFDEIQANVFTLNCTTAGCHGGAGAQLGLRLDAGFSFDNLVDVPSMQVPSLDRVEPGDPDNSYLVQKLEGTAAVGVSACRPAGDRWTKSLIDDIRQWIADGANP